MTPKMHPEIAGEGIEYCWGRSKYEFRHHNDYNPNAEAFERRVRIALLSCNLSLSRKFLRKANDYKRAYRELGEGRTEAGAVYADIEKLRKECKTHRCTFDQDYKFIVEAS